MDKETERQFDIDCMAQVLVGRNLHPDQSYTVGDDILADGILREAHEMGASNDLIAAMRRIVEQQKS